MRPVAVTSITDLHPDTVRDLKREFEQWIRTTPKYRGTETKGLQNLSTITRKLLEALGYVDEPAAP
ncbi:MAG: hypothetical protein O7E57_15295 [Gammaproteobacteria bacterium]|nr:hypothetical protein [Gammaproteobacteria bacterium]